MAAPLALLLQRPRPAAHLLRRRAPQLRGDRAPALPPRDRALLQLRPQPHQQQPGAAQGHRLHGEPEGQPVQGRRQGAPGRPVRAQDRRGHQGHAQARLHQAAQPAVDVGAERADLLPGVL